MKASCNTSHLFISSNTHYYTPTHTPLTHSYTFTCTSSHTHPLKHTLTHPLTPPHTSSPTRLFTNTHTLSPTGLPTIAGLGESLILPLRGLLMLDAADGGGNTDHVSLRNHTHPALLSSEGVRGMGGNGMGGSGTAGSRAGAGAGIVYRPNPSSELILSTGKPSQGQSQGGRNVSKSLSACCDGVDGGGTVTTTRTVSLPTRYKTSHHPSSSSSSSSSSPPLPSSSSSSLSGDGHLHHHHHHHPHHSSMFRSSDSVPGTWRDSLTGSYIPPTPNQQGLSLFNCF